MAEHEHAMMVRKAYEAFSAGDMDRLRGMLTADCTHHVPGSHPMSGDMKGADACIEYYRKLGTETNGTLRVELKDLLVDGRGHVMTMHHATAERAGKKLDMTGGIVFRIIGDKITDLDECVADLHAWDGFWS